jgi:hypothetical protein
MDPRQPVLTALAGAEQALVRLRPDDFVAAGECLQDSIAWLERHPELRQDAEVLRHVQRLNRLMEQAGKLRLSTQNWTLEG